MTRRHDIADALRAAPVPDAAEAQERGWELAGAAFARRPQVRRRAPRRLVAAAVAAAALACAAVVSVTPPGEAVADWVRSVVRAEPKPPPPALASLPAGGEVLALAGHDLWIVHAGGERRRLGSYEDATFSPHALFIAATRGSRLAALDPRGRVRWALDRRGGVADPRWAPSGLRVAYRAGPGLRVVYGDGAMDRVIAARVAAVAPAWRPAAHHQLAWADARGRVVLADTDSGRRLWRGPAGPPPLRMLWSPDGARLLVVRPDHVAVYTASGRAIATTAAPGAAADAAWLPDGRRFITTATRLGRTEVVLHAGGADHVLFSGPGGVDGLAVSPDGRWVLVGWSGADQWLFVRADGRGRPRTAAAMARDFTPDAGAAAPFPRPLGWK